MKRNSKTIIPYEDIDYELVDLIKCINEVDGIETTECCCGHGTMPCQIWFKADSIEDVTHFIHNYLYCNPLWRIVFDLSDSEIDDNEWNNPTYLLETTCSDYFYTGVSIDNLKYKMQQKQRELKGEQKRMKLIVDIDDKVYNDLKNRCLTGMLTAKECECMNEAIYNGTPLEDIVDGIKSHKWGNNEGSKEIYNNAIDDVLTYIEEKIKENKQ